jgi:tRNA threonylcarbamoyladenosine biosynthesis protein TsaE
MLVHTYTSNNPKQTESLGETIGEKLAAGSVIALSGELGCGKTLLTKGICHGLGVPKRLVNSPTFVLINEYSGRVPVFHLDVYRLETSDDVIDLGLMDYFARTSEGVMIIEWAERIAALLPEDRILVQFTRLSARRRRLVFSAAERYREIIESIPSE